MTFTPNKFWHSVNVNESSWNNVTLRVSSRGHALYAYVNQELIGNSNDRYGFKFNLQDNIWSPGGKSFYDLTPILLHTSGYQFSRQANSQQSVKGDDYSFVFEKPVTLKQGNNTISLLGATVGLAVCFQ